MKKGILHVSLMVALSLNLACQREYEFSMLGESDDFALAVSYNSKVDIIWVIDNSSSMLQHQNRLSSQIDSFMDSLEASKMDYQLGVITTSMGGANANGGRLLGEPKFITKKTPNARKLLKQRFVVGQDGSDNEKGLDSLVEALSPEKLSIEYPNFLRDEALSVVIFLSDEEDHSVSVGPADVIAHLDAIKRPFKDGSRSWVAHFIGVPEATTACGGFNQYATPGYSYLQIAQASEGVIESICSVDLRVALSEIRRKIVQKLSDFHLERMPDLSTLKVYFNGLLIPESEVDGWVYIAEKNLIRFNGSYIPTAEDRIKVDYTPLETKP